MVKIKQKKTMNLPQLIEWAMENEIKHRVFESNPNFDGVTYRLGFDKGGDLYFEESLTPTLLFTVEVEEEITEDTKFKHLIEIEQDDTCYMWLNTSVSAEKQVNDCKNLSKEFHAYIDGEFKLIWTREKGLVE